MKIASRYVPLGVLALTLAIVYGIWYSYGVFMVALLREFGWSRSVLAGAFSVFTLAHGVVNPLVGWLCERIDPPRVVVAGCVLLACALGADSLVSTPWQLYASFGIGTAFAVAASGWVPALVQVQRRFPDRLGLALGIVSSGVGAGMLLVVPLCQLLIDAFGWRAAFRLLAVLCVAWIIPAAVYLLRTAPAHARVPLEQEDAHAADTQTAAVPPVTLAGAMRTAPFWLIMIACLFGNFCSQTLHVHQVAYLVDHGIAAIVGATVVSVVGASSICAKIVGGWISDLIEREIVYVVGILIMVTAVLALAAVGAWSSTWGAYGYALLLGAGYSVTASLTPAMASDRFGGPHFGAIVGTGLLASALGSAIGPWLAGWLFDRTGSYALPLAITAGCGVVAASAGWMLRRIRVGALARAQRSRS